MERSSTPCGSRASPLGQDWRQLVVLWVRGSPARGVFLRLAQVHSLRCYSGLTACRGAALLQITAHGFHQAKLAPSAPYRT